ncbi:MAG: ribE [Rickettsiales bacterium]|jgi:riboflavin synthase|nr:ribE [Rickettsiales bacterium]
MFTGIITHIGTVREKRRDPGKDTRFVIETSLPLHELNIGASIACSGACMTLIEKGADWFAIDVSDESLNCTHMGTWEKGTEINLERSLRMGDELGGHIVTGHVDGLAELVSLSTVNGSHVLKFSAPHELKHFIAAKGSVALDGISLTVNRIDDNRFYINIIPHTWEHTTMHRLNVGSKVHLEADILARYVVRARDVLPV